MMITINSGFFLKQLIKRISHSIVLVGLVAIVYVYLMRFVDHELSWIPYLVIFLALAKTGYFTFFTFKQVNQSIGQCRSFGQLLCVFSLLVLLIIFSYAADFSCLATADAGSFQGLSTSGEQDSLSFLFEFFYFSTVTFAAIGYGDIIPLTSSARILVTLEIAQSFIMIVFGLSNINNIHTSIKNQT